MRTLWEALERDEHDAPHPAARRQSATADSPRTPRVGRSRARRRRSAPVEKSS
jgi:hypothetical protein